MPFINRHILIGHCQGQAEKAHLASTFVTIIFKQGETDMGDKGKKDKGKREQQKKAQLNPKEKRKSKKEKKK
ncbi:MAG: hypothetical protein U9Q89_05610 [Thermodesulfobacteriota bacterium]|nr:hypothetical protein [Thermodesulfobacteriota bacterium]